MSPTLTRLALSAAALVGAHVALAQAPFRYVETGPGTICYLDKHSVNTFVPPPEAYLRMKASNGRTKTSNIQVTYQGFTPQAQAAFEAAVNIWESLLQSDVTIRVLAQWAPLGDGVLGSAGPNGYTMNFDGAQRANVWYPIALAEKMARKNLNPPGAPDIVATFNSNNNLWHYGLDGNPPIDGSYDLISVVLHEIGHGLGLTHGYSVEGATGLIPDFFGGMPVVYETNLATVENNLLVTSFDSPSTALGTQLTGESLFYNSALVTAANGGTRASIYAPDEYDPGSSIAHLDDITYPAGSPNALMTPFINAAERALSPGPIVMNILKEMGWLTTFIEHTPLTTTENASSPHDVVCKVTSDTGFDASTLTLNYSTDGTSFTTVQMLPTGTANQFKAVIPNGHASYKYFISVVDSDNRVITKPGLSYQQGKPITQGVISFSAGPDTKGPTISHEPVEFMSTVDTLKIEAIINDPIGIMSAQMEWKFNESGQPPQALTLKPGTDSTYTLNIIFNPGVLSAGDKIHYRITATDKSLSGNFGFAPSAGGFYEINVTGLEPAQPSYANDFNSLSSSDFSGTGFSIVKPAGFANGAIHSTHPYPASGAGGAGLSLTYQLKIPITISARNAVMKFDEIVLVEPGEAGAPFGSVDFYDFVVVEGSTDGGITWKPAADGYDSRSRSEWLSHYNSSVSGQNSTAAGTPALYRTRSIDLLDKFDVNDVVAFRFRLFSDPIATGWGWAIDNLTIQVDTDAPVIRHQHQDYVMAGSTQYGITSKITDVSGVKAINVEHKIDEGSIITSNLIVAPTTDIHSVTLTFPALTAGQSLNYRITATDSAGNVAVYPPTGFIKVATLSLAAPADRFVTDFSSPSADISGNFFTTAVADGFTDGAIHSPHPYGAALGVDAAVFNYAWYITKPIKVNGNNPHVRFDEVVLTEYTGTTPVDYVVMEASKDGVVWEKLVDEHAANFSTLWKPNFDVGGTGASTMYVRRELKLTDGGKFAPGDVVLIRFRLFSNASITGWGFAVDNLTIQGLVTAAEHPDSPVEVFPNPVTGNELHVRGTVAARETAISVISVQGKVLSSGLHHTKNGMLDATISTEVLAPGLYLLRVDTPEGVIVRKFVLAR